jgi:PAS domain S-box-containing protein
LPVCAGLLLLMVSSLSLGVCSLQAASSVPHPLAAGTCADGRPSPAKPPGEAPPALESSSTYTLDKTVFWIAAVGSAGICLALPVLYLDIRRRKSREARLRMQESTLRQLFNSAGDAIFIHDLQCRVLEVNAAACRLTGFSRDQFLGRSLNPMESAQRPAAGHEPIELLKQHGGALYETLHHTCSGEILPVEVSSRAIEYQGVPAILSIMRDITHRKSLELREKTRLQIVEEMATGAPLEDLLSYIVRFVEQESPGALCSVLLASDSGTRLRLGSAPSLPDFYNQAVDGLRVKKGMGSCGTAAFLRERVIVSDIESHPYWKGFQPARDAGLRACWSEPVLSVNGELLGTFAVYYRSCRAPAAEELALIESAAHMASIAIGRVRSDESRSHLEMQMLHMQKIEAVGQLAAGLAHDFNNLLTPIVVYADIVKRGLAEGDANRGKMEGIISSASKAADLTRQLLSFGRKQILKKEQLDLNEVIVSLHDLLKRTIRANVEIETRLAASGAQILADRGQLEQVLVNLAVNAQDAIEGNGRILVTTENVVLGDDTVKAVSGMRSGPHILLSFSDDGCGMGSEVLDRIFEPFYTTKPVGSGSGLGLATVHGIVEQHRGCIKVQSEAGKGTCFSIYLPCCIEEAQELKERQPALPEPAAATGDKVILVVDDNEQIREMAVELLESSGYRVLVADSAVKARSLAQSHAGAIDLLITDVVMPEMSGPELYEALAVKYPSLPVLYVSGYTFDVKLRTGAQGAGLNFLPKPFTSAELLSGMQLALNGTAADRPQQGAPPASRES